MGTYRAGIVGLSWISADPAGPATHPVLGTAIPFSHASAYAATPGIEVVAACDIDQAASETFRERWNYRWPGMHLYADYREMLQQEQIDFLSVVTPDHLHAEVILAAVEAGVRAIFAEKPLATSLEDADRIIAAVRERGVAMTVNHTRRWMPQYIAAREALRAGEIGPLVTIMAHLGGERAMLFRNHTHVIDMICYFADAEPEWVIGELETGFEDYGTAYRGDGGRDPSLEPGVNAYIGFQNGVRAFLSGMKRGIPQVRIELIGANGHIHVDDTGAYRTVPGDGGPSIHPIVPRATRAGMQAALADLILALETGQPTQSPPEEARKTVAIIMGILESQAQGNARVAVR